MAADLFGETPAAEPLVVTVRDIIACLGREVRMREGAYPKWIRAGRMTAAEARLELARMRAALNLVAAIEAPSEELLDKVGEGFDAEVARLSGFAAAELFDGALATRRAAIRAALEDLVEAVR